MDDNKVKYYPYEEYSESVDQFPQENNGYYQDDGGSKKSSDKSVKTLIGILVAVLLVFVILLGIFVALKKKGKDGAGTASTNATVTDAAVTNAVEQVTTEEERYQPGEYTVIADGNVRLREDHSVDSKHIMSVPTGTKLTISEVYIDSAATEEDQKFWGKTEYKGWTAWVALAYLSRSDGTAEATTAAGGVGVAITTADGETTTGDSSTGRYSTGKYVVTADIGFLRLREDHDVTSEELSQIETDEEITILEIYHDTNADAESLEYWGKVSYDGYVGWVAMYYTAPVN